MPKKVITLLILFFLCTSAYTQNRYMVFFTDKENSPYSIATPSEFLSQRAIDRRVKNGVSLNEDDLPVNPAYLDQLTQTGAEVYFSSRWMNAALVQMEASLKVSIESLPMVDSVYLVANGPRLSRTKEQVMIASDPITPITVAFSTETQNNMLEIEIAHQQGYTGEGVLIAITDSGFEDANTTSPFEHLHENNKILSGVDFVTNSGNPYLEGVAQDHGTKVLSVIAGLHAAVFIGAAPDASFILTVSEDGIPENPVEEYNYLFATEYADSAGADIINASLSYGIFWDDMRPDYPRSFFDGETTVTAIASNFAGARGMLVVSSAGNDGPGAFILSPADSPKVLAVGAVNANESKSSFSSIGPSADGRIKPDVAALGANVTVIGRAANVQQNDGTSFAAPLITGLAACIMEAYPELTASEVKEAIIAGGAQAATPNNLLGYGIPTFSRVQLVLEDLLATDQENLAVFPNPITHGFNLSGPLHHFHAYDLVDMQGRTVLKGRVTASNLQYIRLRTSITPGIYQLILSGENLQQVIRLIKN